MLAAASTTVIMQLTLAKLSTSQIKYVFFSSLLGPPTLWTLHIIFFISFGKMSLIFKFHFVFVCFVVRIGTTTTLLMGRTGSQLSYLVKMLLLLNGLCSALIVLMSLCHLVQSISVLMDILVAHCNVNPYNFSIVGYTLQLYHYSPTSNPRLSELGSQANVQDKVQMSGTISICACAVECSAAIVRSVCANDSQKR